MPDSVHRRGKGARLGRLASQTVMLPTVDPFASPNPGCDRRASPPLHVAVLKGAGVDQPRNLAKPVTVE